MDILFDCSEGEGEGGKAWLLGGSRMCGKPKVKHIPFLVLEPPGPPCRCPGSGPGCHGSSQVQRKPGFPSLEVAVPFPGWPSSHPRPVPSQWLLSSFRCSLAHLSCAATISFPSRWSLFLPFPGLPLHFPLLTLTPLSLRASPCSPQVGRAGFTVPTLPVSSPASLPRGLRKLGPASCRRCGARRRGGSWCFGIRRQ